MKPWKYTSVKFISSIAVNTSIAGVIDKICDTDFINLNWVQLGALAGGGLVCLVTSTIIQNEKLKKIAKDLGYKGILNNADLSKKQKELIHLYEAYKYQEAIKKNSKIIGG